jgi:hypothetical protein
MRTFNTIAFFWIGSDITIPSLLVRSIRMAFGAEFKIIQLSDKTTPKVEGVTTHRQLKLSQHIMVARLEAYSSLGIASPTLFLDADMLVLRPFDLPTLAEHEVGVTIRGKLDTVGFSEEDCRIEPAFLGKNTAQVMPYLYSFVYVRSTVLFARQLNALRKLPKRFHLWYGDQITLKTELDAQKRFMVRPLAIHIFNRTVSSTLEFERICRLPDNICIAHFKGKNSKKAMLESLTLLESG